MKKHNKKEEKELKLRVNKKAVLAVVIIILIAVAVFLVVKKSQAAEQGDTVSVNYILRINSTIYDTNIEDVAREAGIYSPSKEYIPIELTIGAGKFLKGFEDAIYGMKEGETKNVTVPPELAYGNYDPRKIASFNLSQINNSDEIKVGTVLSDKNGNVFKVVALNETNAFVDINSPLAGKSLEFEITLLEVK